VVQDKAQRPPAPANHYSLESDHCYQSDTMSDSMLVNNHITSITPELGSKFNWGWYSWSGVQ